MKHLRDTIKIAIADSSLILRLGISAAIKRASDTDVQFIEIDNAADINNKIDIFKPHVLIISPLFGLQYQPTDIKWHTELKRILLVSSLIEPKIIANYDGVINIYDTDEQIHKLIDSIMNYDEPENDVEEEQLSQREKEIICEVVKGKTNKEIADHLNLSVFTILTHRRNIAKKLQIHSSTALAIYAIANKLVSISDVK